MRETFGALVTMHQAARAGDEALRADLTRIAVEETEHAAWSHDLDAWLATQLDDDDRAKVRAAKLEAFDALAREVATAAPPELVAVAGIPTPRVADHLLAGLRALLACCAGCIAACIARLERDTPDRMTQIVRRTGGDRGISTMPKAAWTVHERGAMSDRDFGIIDVASPFEAGICWCGEPTDDVDVGALGLSFCATCRARMVRSCASLLAIARNRAARAKRAGHAPR